MGANSNHVLAGQTRLTIVITIDLEGLVFKTRVHPHQSVAIRFDGTDRTASWTRPGGGAYPIGGGPIHGWAHPRRSPSPQARLRHRYLTTHLRLGRRASSWAPWRVRTCAQRNVSACLGPRSRIRASFGPKVCVSEQAGSRVPSGRNFADGRARTPPPAAPHQDRPCSPRPPPSSSPPRRSHTHRTPYTSPHASPRHQEPALQRSARRARRDGAPADRRTPRPRCDRLRAAVLWQVDTEQVACGGDPGCVRAILGSSCAVRVIA